MNEKKILWLSIATSLISVVAVSISLISLYFTTLQPAKVTLLPAEEISFWHSDGILNVLVPCIFRNSGAQAGVIHKVALVIKELGDKETALLLSWEYFRYFDEKSYTWKKEDVAFPVVTHSRNSIFKAISFYGGTDSKNWLPQPMTYDLYLLAWSKASYEPDLHVKFEVTFEKSIAQDIKSDLEDGIVELHSVKRADWGKWSSKKLSPLELRELIYKTE